jgi:hypothetical protein
LRLVNRTPTARFLSSQYQSAGSIVKPSEYARTREFLTAGFPRYAGAAIAQRASGGEVFPSPRRPYACSQVIFPLTTYNVRLS